MSNVIFEDRYSATGTPRPDGNSCNECDGMGLFPAEASNLNELACNSEGGVITIIGQKDEEGQPMPDDGWLFVRCPVCKGSRKKGQTND